MEALSLFDSDLAPAPELSALRGRSVRSRSQIATASAPRRTAESLLAIDGNSLAHRAFHAYQDSDRGAAYGFCALFSAVCDRVSPAAVVVGFDCRERSYRKEMFSGYKANRSDKDPRLLRLLEELPVLLRRLGVGVVVVEGWEADDVLGSAAAAAVSSGRRCVVATSDRDAFGLIGSSTTVLRLRSGMDNAVEVDRRRLLRAVGVEPHQYVEFAALRGDVSDNLPGIPGIGRRRAAALLSAFPSVAEAVTDPIGCRSVLGPALGQALIDDLTDRDASVFLRNVALMTIRRDLPVDLAACRRTVSAEAVAERLAAQGLGRLGARMAAAVAARPDVPPPPSDADAPV